MWWSRPRDLAIETEVTFSGADLLAHIASAGMFHFSHADPSDDEEAELIADFLQDLQDYGDIHDEMGAGDRIRESRRMTEALEPLLRRGLFVYTGKYVQTLHVDDTAEPFAVAVVVIRRVDLEALMAKAKDGEAEGVASTEQEREQTP
jgi:hypothetical protein